jgi:hypothetical protein
MIEGVANHSFADLSLRFVEILRAPINFPEMLWIAVPLILTIFLTEIYFSRYQFEELGWNSAYGNALVLIFVAVDLFRYIHNHGLFDRMNIKLALSISVAFLAIALTLVNFLHMLPENIAYGLSSKFPMNFIAYMGVILVYSEIPVDIITAFASLGLMFILSIMIILMKEAIPAKVDSVPY